MLNDIFHKRRKSLNHLLDIRKPSRAQAKITCPHCKEEVYTLQVKENYKICPKCQFYFPMTPEERLLSLADAKSFREHDKNLATVNPLDFPEYEEKLKANEDTEIEVEAMPSGSAFVSFSK